MASKLVEKQNSELPELSEMAKKIIAQPPRYPVDGDRWTLPGTKIKIPTHRGLRDFLEDYCSQEMADLVYSWSLYEDANSEESITHPDTEVEWYPKNTLYIKYLEVVHFDNNLAKALARYPEKIFLELKKALVGFNDTDKSNRPRHFSGAVEGGLSAESLKTILEKLQFRITDAATIKRPIRALGKKDVGRLVTLDGFARIVSKPRVVYTRVAFECLRCGHTTIVDQCSTRFEEPFAGCGNETCGKKGPFNVDISQCKFKDYQQAMIQELPDETRSSQTIDVLVELDEDLVNTMTPGDKVSVTGILTIVQQVKREGKQNTNDFVLQAHGVEKQDFGFEDIELSREDEEEIIELSKNPDLFDMIRESIAPSIYGYDVIKEAIALQLFSAIPKTLPDGTQCRANEHMMIIGEPGLAKSVLLRRAVRLSPRGVYVSGKTASAAGLTASAVHDPLDEGKWILEGGAAVMASGGLLAVDEIGQTAEKDKSALHEVLEQQTVSIAKAAKVMTLRAAVACLAAGNPIDGYFDKNEPLADQIGIPPALLSRFGLIFIMLDEVEEGQDTRVSGHVLNNHMIGGAIENQKHSRNPQYSVTQVEEMTEQIAPPIPEDLLRKYIAYARMHVYPVTTPEVIKEMQKFYLSVRGLKKLKVNNPVPITARDVEALQRLSEARARMRLSDVVELQDVEHAKKIISASLKDVGFDPETGALDAGIVECGRSQSQRKRDRDLNSKIGLIKKVIRDNGEPEAINEEMQKNGVSVEDTEALIKILKTKGEVYFTGAFYKIVDKN